MQSGSVAHHAIAARRTDPGHPARRVDDCAVAERLDGSRQLPGHVDDRAVTEWLDHRRRRSNGLDRLEDARQFPELARLSRRGGHAGRFRGAPLAHRRCTVAEWF
jgi:hypothetical protein